MVLTTEIWLLQQVKPLTPNSLFSALAAAVAELCASLNNLIPAVIEATSRAVQQTHQCSKPITTGKQYIHTTGLQN